MTTLLNALGDRRTSSSSSTTSTSSSAPIHEQLGYFLEHLPAQSTSSWARAPTPPFHSPVSAPAAAWSRSGQTTCGSRPWRRRVPRTMGLSLTADDVATLEGRTEGWIAALQLAALSLGGRPDTGKFIATFAGDDRYIVDYLVEEVLERQPARIPASC